MNVYETGKYCNNFCEGVDINEINRRQLTNVNLVMKLISEKIVLKVNVCSITETFGSIEYRNVQLDFQESSIWTL